MPIHRFSELFATQAQAQLLPQTLSATARRWELSPVSVYAACMREPHLWVQHVYDWAFRQAQAVVRPAPAAAESFSLN